MINKIKDNFYIVLSLFFWIALYLCGTNVAMIFRGDTAEYLDMANQLNEGKLFPSSDAWMPLYPFMIWITSKIFILDLLTAAKVYNLFLGSLFVLVYNLFFVRNSTIDFIERLLLNIPLFLSAVLMNSFVSIMAEAQFLIITLNLLYLSKKIIETNNKNYIILASVMATLSIMTKYNGFANIVFLITVLFYKFGLKSIPYILMVLLLAMGYYIPYLMYKPGGDFLVGGLELRNIDYWGTLKMMSNDLLISVADYILPFRIREYIKYVLNMTPLFWISIVVYVIGAFWLLTNFLKNKVNLTVILITYCYLYFTMMVARWLPMGISEINTRTGLYVFFILSFLMVRYLVQKKEALKMGVLIFFSFLGISANFSNVKSLYQNGDGPLAAAEFKSDSPMVKIIKDLVLKRKLCSDCMFSNQSSILSLYTNFKAPNDLPTYRRFMGNSYENNYDIFKTQEKDFMEFVDSSGANSWLIAYFFMNPNHPRFDSLQLNLVRTFKTRNDVNFVETTHGYVISDKQ
jgi:hypothetical protein